MVKEWPQTGIGVECYRDTTTGKYVKTKFFSFCRIFFLAVPLESSFQDGSNDNDNIFINNVSAFILKKYI